MEKDFKETKAQFKEAFVTLDQNFQKAQSTTQEQCKKKLDKWKLKARDKIQQYKNALRDVIEERSQIQDELNIKLQEASRQNERLQNELTMQQNMVPVAAPISDDRRGFGVLSSHLKEMMIKKDKNRLRSKQTT